MDPPKEEVRILSPSRVWGWPVSPRSIRLKDSAAEGKGPSLCPPRPTCPQHGTRPGLWGPGSSGTWQHQAGEKPGGFPGLGFPVCKSRPNLPPTQGAATAGEVVLKTLELDSPRAGAPGKPALCPPAHPLALGTRHHHSGPRLSRGQLQPDTPHVTCSRLAMEVECLPLKPREVYGGIRHGCRGLPLPFCSPTSTLATEGGLLQLRPTCRPATPEDPQHCSAPHCLSLAPRVLPVLTQLPLLARSEAPGKTCPFPPAHPPTPPPGGPATPQEDSSPTSQLGTAPSVQGLAAVTSPGSPAGAWRAGRPVGPAPAGKGRERGISAAAPRGSPKPAPPEVALLPFGKTETTHNGHLVKVISF